MQTLLRKYLSVVDLAVITLCAIFAARAPSTQIYSKQVEEILNRNIFCSTCPPILKAAEATGGPPQPPPLQRTSLPLKLLAVMYAPTDPRWSMAIIRDNDDKSTGPFGVASTLREAIIDEFDETRAYLDFGGGRREYLELLDPPPNAPAAPVVAAPAAPK